MTLIHYNSLNPAIPLPSCTDEVPHVCLTLMDHLLTPHDDLQETPLVNADLVTWWFLPKKWEWQILCQVCKVIEAAPLPSTTSAQQAELHALTQTCVLAKGKTANVCTDSWHAFGIAHDFGMLWKQWGFLTSSGVKIKNGPYVQNLLDAVLLPAALAVIKVPGHSKSGFLEAKGNHLTRNPAKNATLLRSINQTSVIVQKATPPGKDLRELAREVQQLASEREKQNWKIKGCWYCEVKGLWFGHSNKLVLPKKI